MAIATLPLRPATTIFPSTIVEHDPLPLKRCDGNGKMGGTVRKGPLKGAPIYGLTLVERMYCPPTCEVWNICYGNNMWRAKRHLYTPGLLAAIECQLWSLTSSKRTPAVLVRLHVLSDFPDVA